ncbi:hypothetical protein PM082_013282 [Marasmius tenuissimus]|nr:hypothetical protein PM082_013282 [Marasmius tenuissimus]
MIHLPRISGLASKRRILLQREDVSVKAPKKRPKPDDKQLERGETYLQAMFWQRLQHQNVLPFRLGLYYFDEARSRVCLLTPWMETNLIQLRGVAAGPVYLHSQQVVHGDLSAFNGLIDSAGIPHLGDLGLPQLLLQGDRQNEPQSNCGVTVHRDRFPQCTAQQVLRWSLANCRRGYLACCLVTLWELNIPSIKSPYASTWFN